MAGINRKKRKESFMVKPATGWLHDDRALNAGRGVYVRYPCKFIGTIRCDSSIRSLSADDQTVLARAAIAAVADPTAARTVALTGTSYTLGADSVGSVPVMLAISSKGAMIAMEDYKGGDEDTVGMIDFKEMRLVSLAAGGEDNYFNFATYIAKDAKSGVREAFVFDCGDNIEQILMTMGQAFNLAIADTSARKKSRRKPKPKKKVAPPPAAAPIAEEPEPEPDSGPHVVDYDTGNYKPTDEAFALPTNVEAIYDSAASSAANSMAIYDTANPAAVAPTPEPATEALYDIANPAVAAIVTAPGGEVDDIADELLNLMKSESCAIYETTEQFRQNPLSPAGLVEKLNDKVKVDGPSLTPSLGRPVARPSWVYFKPATLPKKANLDALRAAAQAQDL